MTIVPESNAFALMSRVHLAIVSAHLGIFEDGSFYAPPGTQNIIQACEKFRVPVVALAPGLSVTAVKKPPTSSFAERNGNPAEILKHFQARSSRIGRDVDAILHPARELIVPKRRLLRQQQQRRRRRKGQNADNNDENVESRDASSDDEPSVLQAFVTDHGVVAPNALGRLIGELYKTPSSS